MLKTFLFYSDELETFLIRRGQDKALFLAEDI